jgi:hypothetical protein
MKQLDIETLCWEELVGIKIRNTVGRTRVTEVGRTEAQTVCMMSKDVLEVD